MRTLSVSVQQFVIEFVAWGEANFMPRTLTLFEGNPTLSVVFTKNSSLRELTRQALDRCKPKRLREISSVTVNIELRMIKAAFNTARRWKLLDINLFEDVTFAEIPDREPLFSSSLDFERLLQCVKEKWLEEIVVFAVFTGM